MVKWISILTWFLWRASEFRNMKILVICISHTKHRYCTEKKKLYLYSSPLEQHRTFYIEWHCRERKNEASGYFGLDAFASFKKDIPFSFLFSWFKLFFRNKMPSLTSVVVFVFPENFHCFMWWPLTGIPDTLSFWQFLSILLKFILCFGASEGVVL